MSRGGDISQQIRLDLQGTGGDTVTVLAQATRELQEQFRKAVKEFDEGEGSATKLISTLKGVAAGMTTVAQLANQDAEAMARANAATGAFIEKTNAALSKREAEEARIDAQSKARVDAKLARDQAALDAIGAAADRAAKAAQGAADRMAASDARKEAANAKALADAEGYEAMQRKLGEMERRTQAEIAATAAARQRGTEAIAEHIVKTREQIQAERDEAQATAEVKARREQAFEELRAELDKNRAAYEKEAAATQWVTRQDTELKAVLDQLHRAETTATVDVNANANAMQRQAMATKEAAAHAAGFATHADMVANQTKKLSMFASNLSYAFQDLAQSGFPAVVNNIAQIGASAGAAFPKIDKFFVGLGGLSGVGTAVMAVAAGFDLLYKNWDSVANYFGLGIPRPILDTTDELNRKLKAAEKVTEELGDKTRLTIGEYDQYKKATEEVKSLNRQLERERELKDLLSGQGKSERERATGFKEAVAENGGAMALDTLDTAIRQGADDKGQVFNEYAGKNTDAGALANTLMLEASKGDKRARDAIKAFLQGAYRDSKFAKDIYKYSPEAKADDEAREARGEDEEKGLKELSDAEKKKQAKRDEVREAEEDAAKLVDDIDQEQDQRRKRRVSEAATRFARGFDANLEGTATRHFAEGATADQSAARLAPQLKARLRDAGVEEDIAGDVAEAIIRKVMDRLGNKVEAKFGEGAGGGDAAIAQGMLQQNQMKLDRTQMAQLRMLANQERMAGFIGPFSINLNQIEARSNRIEGVLGRARRPARLQNIKR